MSKLNGKGKPAERQFGCPGHIAERYPQFAGRYDAVIRARIGWNYEPPLIDLPTMAEQLGGVGISSVRKYVEDGWMCRHAMPSNRWMFSYKESQDYFYWANRYFNTYFKDIFYTTPNFLEELFQKMEQDK